MGAAVDPSPRAESSRHPAPPHHGFRLLPAQLHRIERAAHRPSRDAARRSTARAALASARTQGGTRDRRDREAAGISGQRPARNHARRCRADLSQPLRCPRRVKSGDRDRLRSRLSGRTRPARSGCGDRRNCRRTIGAIGRPARGGAPRGNLDTASIDGAFDRWGSARAGDRARRDRHRRTFALGGTRRLRRGFDVRWIHAQRSLVLSVAGQTRMGRGAAGFCAGPIGGARAFGGCLPRRDGACPCARRRCGGRRRVRRLAPIHRRCSAERPRCIPRLST